MIFSVHIRLPKYNYAGRVRRYIKWLSFDAEFSRESIKGSATPIGRRKTKLLRENGGETPPFASNLLINLTKKNTKNWQASV